MGDRSYRRITAGDLNQLLSLSKNEALFNRNPKYTHFRNSLIVVALCQGASQHYADGRNGIKDFDVWYFFRRSRRGTIRYPYRAMRTVDSRFKKFGICPPKCRRTHPKSLGAFVGRHVNLLGREIDCPPTRNGRNDPKNCISAYLKNGKTKTSRELREKPVVGLFPPSMFGRILWKPSPC